jgi:hypothetical protein
MKWFPLFCAVALWIPIAKGGSQLPSSKDMAPPPCPSWYADNEWNVNLWGTYAFTANDYPTASDTIFMGVPFNRPFSDTDSYLEADHAWGGGIDLRYFFHRYFGIGIQGFGLDARRSFGTVHEKRLIGSVLGTLTLRYPIGCSRFSPYVWAGGGAILGGGEVDEIIINDIPAGAIIDRVHRGSKTRGLGQFGGGFEVRLTPHIGLTNDFSWNVIEGSNNNFGMARTGINFAF